MSRRKVRTTRSRPSAAKILVRLFLHNLSVDDRPLVFLGRFIIACRGSVAARLRAAGCLGFLRGLVNIGGGVLHHLLQFLGGDLDRVGV